MNRVSVSSIAFATIFVALMTSLISPVVVAQDVGNDIVLGKQITIHSEVLDEDYAIFIATPFGYENSDRNYPVLYLLDGMGHFRHTIGTISSIANSGRMPRFIVVGIGNTHRTRDLTLPHENEELKTRMPTSGGADDFLSFIKSELMPYVESNYRTADYRMLVGHSFGGIFTTYAMLYSPETFNAHIAISPSLWWDDEMLRKKAETFFEKSYIEPRSYYVTMGDEGEGMNNSFEAFIATLEEHAPESFNWGSMHMMDENHGSTPFMSTYHGMRLIFADWDGREALASGDLDKIKAHYNNLSTQFCYSVQPGENTINMLGYQFMQAGKMDTAVEVFKYNIHLYPDSANVYDSFGECLETMEKFEQAMKNYAQAVKIASQSDGDDNLSIFKTNLKRMQDKLEESQ